MMKTKTWVFFCPMPPSGCGNIVVYTEGQKKSDKCPYCGSQMEYKGSFDADSHSVKLWEKDDNED
jgi:hypothetical protein